MPDVSESPHVRGTLMLMALSMPEEATEACVVSHNPLLALGSQAEVQAIDTQWARWYTPATT